MKVEILETAGWGAAIEGMRNPMNSWNKSDSYYDILCNFKGDFIIGENDLKLCQTLIKGGTEHRKFLRMIGIWMNFYMPRFWWSEFDTYKIGTVANSCSTMHKLLQGEKLTYVDFEFLEEDSEDVDRCIYKIAELQNLYKNTKGQDNKNILIKRAKSVLLEGFIQKRTVSLNYEVVYNMYHQRKNHRLIEEWQNIVCGEFEKLPYFKELIL